MDVFVSLPDNEPFGMVVEAMGLGKPVIASASGGPTEIITDGENGPLALWRHGMHLQTQFSTILMIASLPVASEPQHGNAS